MIYIKLEKFAEITAESNNINKKKLIKSLKETLNAKNNGATCMGCGAPIWAAGSAITGLYRCFSCATGEADSDNDYEIY